MPFDNYEVALRVRALMTELDESAVNITIPTIQAHIPSALEEWSRHCFANRKRREMFKKDILMDVVGGVADLSDHIDGTTSRMHLEDLRTSTVYLVSTGTITALLRTLHNVNVTAGSNVVFAEMGDFSANDVGRIIKVYDGKLLALDATINTVDPPETAYADNTADETVFGGTAEIYGDEIVVDGIEATLTWLSSLPQLMSTRAVGSLAPACFLRGDKLHTRATDGSTTSLGGRKLMTTIPCYPADVSEIPVTLQHEFISTMVEFLKRNAIQTGA